MTKLEAIVKTLKNDITFSSCDVIAQFAKPLYKMGITEFTYLKLFNNGRRIDLCNNLAWTTDYFENFFELRYADNVLMELNLDNKKITIVDELSDNSVLKDGNKKFGVRNAVGLLEKQSDGQEIFYFGSKNDSMHMLNVYINNIEFLKKFRFYFKEHAQKLIKLAFESELTTPQKYYEILKEKINTIQKKPKSEAQELTVNKYILSEEFSQQHLTAREVECIKWSMLGKGAVETAMILGLAKRTVEIHLENAKRKLNCYNKHQLIGKVIELGILSPHI